MGRLLWRRLAGAVLAERGCDAASAARGRDGSPVPVVPAGTGAVGHGPAAPAARVPVAGTAIWCAIEELESAGEGWVGGA